MNPTKEEILKAIREGVRDGVVKALTMPGSSKESVLNAILEGTRVAVKDIRESMS